MKSKVKSPEWLSSLKESAYKNVLKSDLNMLSISDEPQAFLMFLEHKFSDGGTDVLFVPGYANAWKTEIKKNRMEANFSAGHCSFSNSGNSPTLSLTLERGKARPNAITKALRKHPVLKNYELKIVENLLDQEADQAENELSKVKPKDKDGKAVFGQIQNTFAAYKKAVDDNARETALKDLEALIKLWRLQHPSPASDDDKKIAAELQKLSDWIPMQRKNMAAEKDHESGNDLIDEYTDCKDELKEALDDNAFNSLENKLKQWKINATQWLSNHANIAKGNQDAIITKQHQVLSQAVDNVPSLLKDISNARTKQSNRQQVSSAAKNIKNVLPSADKFAQSAGILVGENPEIDAIIKQMESLQESEMGQPSLDARLRDMLDNGIADYDEFKDVFDLRLKRLYDLRDMIQTFLKKNKGLFSQVTEKQKKRIQGINALLQYVEQEIGNGSKMFLQVTTSLLPVSQMLKDDETAAALEPFALMGGDSSANNFKVLRLLQTGKYMQEAHYKELVDSLLQGELNIPEQLQRSLLKEFDKVALSPQTQNNLNTIFAPNANGGQLIAQLANNLQTNFVANVVQGSDMQKKEMQAAVLNSPEITAMTKLLKQAIKSNLSQTEQLNPFVAKIKDALEKMKSKQEGMQKTHPQYEGLSGKVQALQSLLSQYDGRVFVLKNGYRNAENIKQKLKNGDDSYIDDVIQGNTTHASTAFYNFCLRVEKSSENIDAIRDIYAGKLGSYFIKRYLLDNSPDLINVTLGKVRDTLCQEATQMFNLNPAVTDLSLLSDNQMDGVFTQNSAAYSKINSDLIRNFTDPKSNFAALSVEKIADLLA